MSARIEAELFGDYMRLRRVSANVGGERRVGLLLSGPGHDVAIVAALMLDPDGRPHTIVKGGDTRPARVLRGEPYVKTGIIGGRLDHEGVDAAATAAMEITEETGALLEEGSLLSLGERPSATMPTVSTECDHYHLAVVYFPPGAKPVGDGGGMELAGLIRPLRLSAQEILPAIDRGLVGEGARARVAFSRAFSAIGYLPQLDKYLHELDPEEAARFDPLGLPRPLDPRTLPTGPLALPELEEDLAATVDRCRLATDLVAYADADGFSFHDATAIHLAPDGTAMGKPYRVQFLHCPYDLAKVAWYAPDPLHGALVRWGTVTSLPLIVREQALRAEWFGEAPLSTRGDVAEYFVPVREGLDPATITACALKVVADAAALIGAEAPAQLGASADASPGQSDLRYHFFAGECPRVPQMIPLAEAIRRCREGHGDAATETLLLRLADRLRFIPELSRRW